MADGGLTLHLDEALAERLRAAAAAAGEPVESFARGALEAAAAPDGWAEADAAFEQYRRDGVSYDAREVLDAFVERVEKAARERP